MILALIVPNATAWAGGITIQNNDRNKVIVIKDYLDQGSISTILYATRPAMDQAHKSEECTLNFYLLKLDAGLADAQPLLLTDNFCAFDVNNGTILASNDVLLVSGDQVQTWRSGEGKINDWSLGSVDVLSKKWKRANTNGALLDVSRDGKLVFARSYGRTRKDTSSPSGLVVGLDGDGQVRWQIELNEPGVALGVMDVWAAADGGALLHLVARSMEGGGLPGVEAPAGTLISQQNRLHRISENGELLAPIVIGNFQTMDFANPAPIPDMSKDPQGYQAYLKRSSEMSRMHIYTEGQIDAKSGDDSVMDVMMGRNSREARFMRINAGGEVLMDVDLSEVVKGEGLENWVDYTVKSDKVLLFGALSTRKYRLSQGYVSQIDFADESAITRLAPMSDLGLEKARQAGDAELQYLEHNPSQQPQLLARLGNNPLTVSLVYRSRRQAIQLDEIDGQQFVYTEARDERQAKANKEAQKARRKADREAMQEQGNQDMAAAIGVSDDEYAAMGNRERKEAMIRSGDMNAILAAAMKNADIAQQQATQQQANGQTTMSAKSSQQDIPANLPPELAAAMAQAQQAMAEAGLTMPNMPGMPSTPQGVPPSEPAGSAVKAGEKTVPVDAGMRGYLEFEHPDGLAVTLLIFDRDSSRELLRKEYDDGSIYEYIDFSRFQLPLNQIAVTYRDSNNQVLEDLTPAVAR